MAVGVTTTLMGAAESGKKEKTAKMANKARCILEWDNSSSYSPGNAIHNRKRWVRNTRWIDTCVLPLGNDANRRVSVFAIEPSVKDDICPKSVQCVFHASLF